MSDATALNGLSAIALKQRLASQEESLQSVIASYRKQIEQRETLVGAWQHLDWENVQEQVDTLNNQTTSERGPLWGIPVAVKDVFDTVDMPTCYGSSIYRNHQPAADAACVARLRSAGAVILGKTVTTEFAFWGAGKTRHPLNPDHSPGGSSSGSAAAVADCMAALALGTQTAASTIRPAAYCGIVGFKPSHGLISLSGVKALANSLDTVGVFGRSVADVGLIGGVLCGDTGFSRAMPPATPPVIRRWTGPELESADDRYLGQLEAVIRILVDAGADQVDKSLPPRFEALCAQQGILMAYEANRELAFEQRHANAALSKPLRDLLKEGASLTPASHHRALQLRDRCLHNIELLFEDAEILVMPSATSTAPLLEQGTGDPIMSRAWTLLGLPSISLPVGLLDGLPVGLQLAARPGRDEVLLSCAGWVESTLSAP